MAVKARATPGRPRPKSKIAPATGAGDRPLKIGEAAELVGVEAYVLRFWETQFPFLKPKHTRSHHRFYEATDLKTLKLIKELLHTEGFTIAGAKKHIREIGLERLLAERSGGPAVKEASASIAKHTADKPVEHALAEIREELKSLREFLKD